MFGLSPDTVYPVIIIMIAILLFEWAGGLSSVALTDAVQGFVMVISFIALPSVIKKNFGGWSDLDPSTYPQPRFYQNPSADAQWLFWQFAIGNFGFFTLPHFVQRTYAARDLGSLRAGYMLLSIGPWFTLFVGTFVGTVGVQMLADEPTPANPFAAILEQVMLLGGFAEVVGVLAFTASLAAIMSTADSLIIAISQLVTSDIVYPLKPDATPVQITWIGRSVSLCSTIVAILIGLFWDTGVSALAPVQFGISLQAVPSFIIGLFAPSRQWDVHPWNLAGAAWAGVAVTVAVYFGYVNVDSNPRPINSGVLAFACQLGTLFLLECGRRIIVGRKNKDAASPEKAEKASAEQEIADFSARPVWDFPKMERFGQRPLTPAFLWKLMEGIKEPITNAWLCCFLFLLACVITPLIPENQPPIDENGEFVYPPVIFNGLPWWAFKISLVGIIPTMTFFVMAYRLPYSFEPDEVKIMKEGVDPDAVIMTTPEMGRRASYDERNTLIHRRRSTISDQMANLHMVLSTPSPVQDDPGRRRLSALVKGDMETKSVEDFLPSELAKDVSIEPSPVKTAAREVVDEENNVAVEESVELHT